MNIIESQKEKAWDNFLRLPLYEDMAPWNIVFLGCKLDYIDYDSRDKTFDIYVEKAYYILLVLANYKRTISDFKRCGEDGDNKPYNFPHIGSCIKSEFKGPCKDPSYPIACGDGSCQSTYIHCLKSLRNYVYIIIIIILK